MRNKTVRLMAEIALTVALFALLDTLNPIRMPAGGSVALVMLPLIVLALLRGPVVGMTAGLLCGLVDLAFNPYVLSAPQVILDYPVAYALVGLAGLCAPLLAATTATTDGRHTPATRLRAATITVGACVLGTAGRFCAALFSGVIFFAANTPAGQNVWLYSATYNLFYLLPSLAGVALCAALAVPLLANLFAATPPASKD